MNLDQSFWNGNYGNITNESSYTISTTFTSGDDPLLVNILGKIFLVPK